MNKLDSQVHNIPPVFNSESKILILGSFPSVLSRKETFFYAHPQNRFWKLLEKIYEVNNLNTIDNKKGFLLKKHIALWDVIHSCEIKGSNDSSIQNIVTNDLSIIIDNANIEAIYVNGKTAFDLYNKHIYPIIKREAVLLPSTSSANAAYSLDKLYNKWKIIKERSDGND